MNVLIAASTTNAVVHPVDTAEKYEFNGDGKRINFRTRSAQLLLPLRKVESIANFLDRPLFPRSKIPASMPLTRIRNTIYLIFTDTDSKLGMVFAGIMISTILLSIIAFCLSSMPEYRIRAARNEYGEPERAFDTVETFCVSIFTIEYLARILCLTAEPNAEEAAYIEKFGFDQKSNDLPPMTYSFTVSGMVKLCKRNAEKLLQFILSPLNIVDFIAIVPYYISLASPSSVGGSLAILRVLRLARVLRLFKMSKRMEGVQVMGRTMMAALDALGFLFFFVLLAVVLFGSIIFFCEGGEWDESEQKFMRMNYLGSAMEETPFKSIPHSFWWTIVTMTTVGFGEFVPTSDAGRTIGSFVMLIGILVLAMPITVIGSAFSEEYTKARNARREREANRLKEYTPQGSPNNRDDENSNHGNTVDELKVEPVDVTTKPDGSLGMVLVPEKKPFSPSTVSTSSTSIATESHELLTTISRTLAAQNEELTRLRSDCAFLRTTLEDLVRNQKSSSSSTTTTTTTATPSTND